MSDNWCLLSLWSLMFVVWGQTSNACCQIYDVWCVMSDVRCLMLHIFFLMKAALPKRRRFICNYQRLTYHLPTFNTHKRYAGTPFICIQWQWPCSETNGQSIRSGKTAAKVFKNGQDRPWDATLKEPVPQLSRLLVSDWPNRGPALIAPPSSSSYTK